MPLQGVAAEGLPRSGMRTSRESDDTQAPCKIRGGRNAVKRIHDRHRRMR